MTGKRFEMIITDIDGNFYYLDKVTNEKIKSTLTLENKLNELNDENEQLKFQLDECRNHKLFSRRELEKENEDLKEKLESLDEIINNQIYEVRHTHKNCKKVGIAELKKLKKVLICNSIIQDGDVE